MCGCTLNYVAPNLYPLCLGVGSGGALPSIPPTGFAIVHAAAGRSIGSDLGSATTFAGSADKVIEWGWRLPVWPILLQKSVGVGLGATIESQLASL
jgi:hypothetical protein